MVGRELSTITAPGSEPQPSARDFIGLRSTPLLLVEDSWQAESIVVLGHVIFTHMLVGLRTSWNCCEVPSTMVHQNTVYGRKRSIALLTDPQADITYKRRADCRQPSERISDVPQQLPNNCRLGKATALEYNLISHFPSSVAPSFEFHLHQPFWAVSRTRSEPLQIVARHQTPHPNTLPSFLNLRFPPSIILQSQYGQKVAFAERQLFWNRS
jgi:hypothetical protein